MSVVCTAAHETVATMGFEAAKQALALAGVTAEQIGLIIVATTSGRTRFRVLHARSSQCWALRVARRLMSPPPAPVSLYALSVADQYVKNGAVDYALVVGADVLARTGDPADRGTIIIFGDGAGAVVPGRLRRAGHAYSSTHLHADGSYGELLTLPNADRCRSGKPRSI